MKTGCKLPGTCLKAFQFSMKAVLKDHSKTDPPPPQQKTNPVDKLLNFSLLHKCQI